MHSRLLVVLVMSGLPLACGSDPTPQDPDGGYLAFRDALLSGRPSQLWEWISQDTKQRYEDGVSDLAALAESVRLLSPADRAVAYERTPIRLADRISSGRDLFEEVIRLENLHGDERYRLGTEIDEVRLVDDRSAVVLTRSGQEVALVREEDGIWRVSSLAALARGQLRSIGEAVAAVDILAANSAYMRRSHEEIVRLLGGGTAEGSGQSAP